MIDFDFSALCAIGHTALAIASLEMVICSRIGPVVETFSQPSIEYVCAPFAYLKSMPHDNTQPIISHSFISFIL